MTGTKVQGRSRRVFYGINTTIVLRFEVVCNVSHVCYTLSVGTERSGCWRSSFRIKVTQIVTTNASVR